MSEVLIFGTVAAALVLWAVAEWYRDGTGPAGTARAAWSAGAVFMTVHSIAAFTWLYGGSHDAAVAATARQTAALTGIDSGAGIYVNYAFLALWIADAAWWWIAPAAYVARRRIIATSISGVFLFMFLNGAVIFADGWMRVLGATAVIVVIVAWVRGCRRRRSVATAIV